MKISRIRLTEVIVPARPDSVNSPEMDKPLHMLAFQGKSAWSLQFDQLPKTIIELELDNGIVGLGEAYRGLSRESLEALANALLGEDVRRFNLQQLPLPYGRYYDGFECAILDAYGKASDLSVSHLLGGRFRESVYCGYWTGHRTIADAGRKAKEGLDAGYDCIKFKCCSTDPVPEWCQAVRDACGPDFKIILDPNQRFENVPTAMGLARDIASVGNVLCLEDPIARWDLQGLAYLRSRIDLPIALHVSIPYNEMGYQHECDALKAIQQDCCDYFNFNGGIHGVKRLATLAALAHKPFWHGSEIDLGILEAAYVHKCAASAEALLPSDIFGRVIREHDLLKTPLHFHGHQVDVPNGPGLGVELDQEAMNHYQTYQWQSA